MNDHGSDCSEVESSLALFVGGTTGGDLEPSAHAAIERHLAGCARCRDLAHGARAARGVLVHALGADARPAPDLWPGVRAALVAEGRIADDLTGAARRAQESRRPVSAESRPRRWITLGSAAAAALLLGFWLGRAREDLAPVRPVEAPPTVVEAPAAPEARDPRGRAQLVPVLEAHPAGLRRVGAGEAALADSAEPFVSELPWSAGPNLRDGRGGTPASLQSTRPMH